MPAVTKRLEESSEIPDKEHGEDSDADASKAATIKPASPRVDKTPEP